MTQYAWRVLDPTQDNGVTLAQSLNSAMAALYAQHAGPAAPPNPVAGQAWWDTSFAAAETPVAILREYTGSTWATLATVNLSSGAVTYSGVLPLDGSAPLTGNLMIQKATPVIQLAATAAGQGRQIIGYTNGLTRWVLNLGNNVAETGGNAGSDFVITRADDAGAGLGRAFEIARATGGARFYGTLQTDGGLTVSNPGAGFIEVGGATTAYVDLKTPGSDDYDVRLFTDGTGGKVISAGPLYLEAAGGLQYVLDPAGHHWFSHPLEVPGVVSSQTIAAPSLSGGAGGAGNLLTWGGDHAVNFRWPGDGYLAYRLDETVEARICTALNARDLNLTSTPGGPVGVSLNLTDGSGNLFGIYTDAASDARIKRNIRPTEVDALEVIRSTPVRAFDIDGAVAAYIRGIGATPEERAAIAAEPAADRPVAIGFIAQELLERVAEAVSVQVSKHPDGSPLPDDLHTIILQNLVPYLWRGTQQQDERIAALEARLAALEAKR